MHKRQYNKNQPRNGGFAWLTPARERLLTVLAGLSALVLVVNFAISSWVSLPQVPVNPDKPTTSPNQTLPSGTGGANVEVPDKSEDGIRDRREGVYTFLVAGKDTAGGGNTDTMILITYDTINQKIDAINLPRDTMVNVPYTYKKLNLVYNYSKGSDKATQLKKGTDALKKEVGQLTGIYPDFYVVVSWDAVGKIVDAIGGVWFDVPFKMDYDDPTPGQELYIHQEAGYRLLTGDDAMQVIRHRQNNDGSHAAQGDIGRIQVQQDFLKAMAAQCLKPEILLKAPQILEIFLDEVQTDLTLGNLLAFAQCASGMDASTDITMSTMPYTDYYRYTSYVLPLQDEFLEILNTGINPYDEDILASDLEILYQATSGGGMAVTNGTLEDPSIAKAPYTPPATTAAPTPEPSAEPSAEPSTEPVETPAPTPEETTPPETAPPEGDPAPVG